MNSPKLGGIAIAAGGVFLIIVNAVFTPMLDLDAPFAEMAASQAFLWRLSLAALTVFLFMIGSPGLHAYQAGRSGLFGKLAFGLAFLGCALLFAHEWAQVFFIHNMALVAPDALEAMEDTEGMSASDLEGVIVLITFTLGWIAFAASMLAAKVYSRLGPALVIAGFFAIPLITTLTSLKLGGALGNAVLGSGFILLGVELFKKPA
jgi:hypothetical protein